MQKEALIQATFHIDPNELTVYEFHLMSAKAEWLEEHKLKNIAELIQAFLKPK